MPLPLPPQINTIQQNQKKKIYPKSNLFEVQMALEENFYMNKIAIAKQLFKQKSEFVAICFLFIANASVTSCVSVMIYGNL